MKKILPVAVLAAMAGVNGAQAVYVDSDGLGQVLLYPYYTTTEGQDTYINLVNTTDRYKAVKVRILESMNSREVLDFNLYLSPWDHWSAVITADTDGPGATITSADTSCTVPNQISDGVTVPFRNFEYDDDSVNGLERTKEGYVEVIEMATIVPGAENWPADIKHVAGTPPGCEDLQDSWIAGGVWSTDPNDGTSAPSGGLYGYGVLINVDEGTNATYDAIALGDFFDDIAGVLHTEPGSLDPSLNNSVASYDVINGSEVLSGQADDGLDAVSAIMMHDTLSNDFVMEPTIAAGTDWVVTFPTKRDYVAVDPAIAPFTDPWDPTTSNSCEEFTIRYWDREEGEPTDPPGSIDFSPKPDPDDPDVLALCAEANVVSFAGSAGDVDLGSSVLAADPGRNGLTFTLEDGFANGWARMDFTLINNATDPRPVLEAGENSFEGLPAVGFAVQKYVNSTLEVDGVTVLSNYAGAVTHKSSRSASSSSSASMP